MKKILIIFAAGLVLLPFQSCRETVPPETLEDEAHSTEDTADTTAAFFHSEEDVDRKVQEDLKRV